MKKIIICLLFFVFLITGCGKKEETIKPLFYKATNPNNDSVIYLLGSIHAADESLEKIDKKIIDSFDSSSILAVEFDMKELYSDFSKQIELSNKLMYDDGSKIYDHISSETYDKIKKFLEENSSYSSMYDSFKPAFFESLIENINIDNSNLDPNNGVDMFFLNKAYDSKKKVVGLETAEMQYDLLLSFSDELYDYLLSHSIDDFDKSVEELSNLYQAWLRGNEKELNEIVFEDEEIEDEHLNSLLKDYDNKLIYERNKAMTVNLEKINKEGNDIFCVVGLAHIIGEDGIAELLTKKGYVVEQIK